MVTVVGKIGNPSVSLNLSSHSRPPVLSQKLLVMSSALLHVDENSEVVDRFDHTLVDMMTDPSGVDEVRRLANDVGDALLSHLAYEENELLGPLGRSSILM